MNKVMSYAKINLGLQIDKKLKNGYHKIKTIMTLIELHDEMYFENSDSIFVSMDKNICHMADNLCYKVAIYLQKKYNIKNGIKIHIKKNIPDGAGLGGGSSNAAETLKFLNKAWNLNLSQKKLKKIGSKFGCDIPFFIEGGVCYAKNMGEKVKKIKNKLSNEDIVLIIPEKKIKTKDVYNCCIVKKEEKIRELLKNINCGEYKKSVFNQLEDAANIVSDNLISQIKNEVCNQVAQVFMTGSGSAVVCLFDNNKEFLNNKNIIQSKFKDCTVIESKLKMYSY